MIKEFDVVVLKTPLPAYGLVEGDEGTVLEAYRDHDSYTVEFMRGDETREIASVRGEDLRVVWRRSGDVLH